jgi:hypothetical protein
MRTLPATAIVTVLTLFGPQHNGANVTNYNQIRECHNFLSCDGECGSAKNLMNAGRASDSNGVT